MAAATKKKKAPAKKKVGGASRKGLDKPAPEPGDEPIADGASLEGEDAPVAVSGGDAPADAGTTVEEGTYIVCRQGGFQVIPPHDKMVDGILTRDPGVTWRFPGGRPYLATPEDVKLARQVLNGEFSWGRVTAQHYQKLARKAGLAVIEPAMANPPMPSWDRTSADNVVELARGAGLLDTLVDVENAIRYESQATDRGRETPPSDLVLTQLEGRRAELVALEPKDGPSAGEARLSGGAVGLG